MSSPPIAHRPHEADRRTRTDNAAYRTDARRVTAFSARKSRGCPRRRIPDGIDVVRCDGGSTGSTPKHGTSTTVLDLFGTASDGLGRSRRKANRPGPVEQQNKRKRHRFHVLPTAHRTIRSDLPVHHPHAAGAPALHSLNSKLHNLMGPHRRRLSPEYFSGREPSPHSGMNAPLTRRVDRARPRAHLL